MADELGKVGQQLGKVLGQESLGRALGEAGDSILGTVVDGGRSRREFEVVEIEERDGWTVIGPYFIRYVGSSIHVGEFVGRQFYQVAARLK